MAQNAPLASSSAKSREKKQRLVNDVAQMESIGAAASKAQAANIKLEAQQAGADHDQTAGGDQDEDDDDPDDEQDDDMDETGSDKAGASSSPKTASSFRMPKSARNNKCLHAMWTLLNQVKDYRTPGDDQLGVVSVVEPFMKLPSKRVYPDYYEEIKRPLALACIQRKLRLARYASIAQLVADLQLVFGNAMQYNVEESLIYLNAKRLLEFVRARVADMPAALLAERVTVSSATTVDDDTDAAAANEQVSATPQKRTAAIKSETISHSPAQGVFAISLNIIFFII